MLVLPIVAMLALSTTLAEAGERHVRKVIHQMSDARGRFVPAPTYFGDRDCTSAGFHQRFLYRLLPRQKISVGRARSGVVHDPG
jgi:hypothetical protein